VENSKEKSRRILMVSFLFPPYGGMAPQRTVYFANRLLEKGKKVDVLTIKPSRSFPWQDAELLNLVAPAMGVHRVYPSVIHNIKYKLLPQKSSAGRISGIRSIYYKAIKGFVIPMASVEWMCYGAAAAFNLHRKYKYDLIYTHGDPFTSHLIGLFVKKYTGIPWLVYVSDPFYFGAARLLHPSWRRRLDRYLEKNCMTAADKIIVNCSETLNGFLQEYPFLTKEKFVIITDGFDEQRYEKIERESSDGFRVLYTGTFYDDAREPFALFDAVSKFGDGDVEMVFAGYISPAYQRMVEQRGLADKVKFLGHQPHSRIVALQKGASVLLNVGWGGGCQVPGKLFEYFAARKPIIAIKGDEDDVAAKFVLRHGRGLAVDNNGEKIYRALLDLYGRWKRGRLSNDFDLSPATEFSWNNLANKFEVVINEML
jgi:glycosyltransferase involved in cell wall biosynthesis